MNLNSTWSVLEDVYDILGGYGFAAMDKAAAEMELKPDWTTWLFAIWLFGSEPITPSNFMQMFPYGLARLNDERFASAVQHGYLVSDGQNGYLPTESGMKAAQRVWRDAGDSIASLNSMPDEQLGRLFEYLARLGKSAMSAPEPPPHYFMSHKRENYQHFKVLYPLERFVVLFGELAAYRDDCYISTWGAHRVEGHAWDAFDQLVQSGALTHAGLFAKVNRRGITEEVLADDVRKLIGRGWVEEGSGAYQITSVGRQVRVEVEAQTERSFFAPWSCLSEAELKDLLELSIQLRDNLKEG
jgi:hypothetical protein